MVLLGGGKAAQAKGGGLRRVMIHDMCMTEEDAMAVYMQAVGDNPMVGGRVKLIQARWRAAKVREALSKQGIETKQMKAIHLRKPKVVESSSAGAAQPPRTLQRSDGSAKISVRPGRSAFVRKPP